MQKVFTGLKIFISCFLFGVFLQFFGLPAFERYMNRSVVVNTNTLTGNTSLDSPGITVCQEPSDNLKLIMKPFRTFCNNLTSADDAIKCLENKFTNFSQMITAAEWSGQKLTELHWKSSITNPMFGKCFTLKKGLKLGHSGAVIFLNRSNAYNIFIHDPEFFIISYNTWSVPKITRGLKLPLDRESLFDYQNIVVMKHKKIDRKNAPCENDEAYSFTKCVEESILKMAECNLQSYGKKPSTLRDCTTVDQIKRYLWIYLKLINDDLATIRKVTQCKTPCFYLEYVDAGKKLWRTDLGNWTTLAFGLAFASMEVTVLEEIYIYPLTSFLAETGGALGMFLGLSLLMVWDVVIDMLKYGFVKISG